jgi:hypothetical protein
MDGRTRIHRISTVASAAVLFAFALAGCGGGGGGTPGIGGSTTGTVIGGATGGGGTAGTVVGGATGGSGSWTGGTTGTTTGGTTGGSGSSTYTATAIVTVAGVAKPGVPVILSSGVAATSPNAPGVIATQVTNQQGVAVFPNLIPGTNYCFTAAFTDSTGSHQVVSCSNRGDTTILLQF